MKLGVRCGISFLCEHLSNFLNSPSSCNPTLETFRENTPKSEATTAATIEYTHDSHDEWYENHTYAESGHTILVIHFFLWYGYLLVLFFSNWRYFVVVVVVKKKNIKRRDNKKLEQHSNCSFYFSSFVFVKFLDK